MNNERLCDHTLFMRSILVSTPPRQCFPSGCRLFLRTSQLFDTQSASLTHCSAGPFTTWPNPLSVSFLLSQRFVGQNLHIIFSFLRTPTKNQDSIKSSRKLREVESFLSHISMQVPVARCSCESNSIKLDFKISLWNESPGRPQLHWSRRSRSELDQKVLVWAAALKGRVTFNRHKTQLF